MKKMIAMLLVIAMMACLFVGCGPKAPTADPNSDFATIAADGKVIVGITDFAPMDFKDANGEWTGFDAELARLVFGELDLEVEFVEIDWDNKILELDNGSIDCVWNGMTLTDEVKNAMSCSDPYVVNAQVVVMKAENASEDMTAESIVDLGFAVEAGSAGEGSAANCGYENIISVAAQSNALMEVAAGTADACIIDLTMANAMIGEGTSYADLVKVLELDREEYGIGFRKGSDLTAKVNEIMANLKADGTMQALADEYELVLCD